MRGIFLLWNKEDRIQKFTLRAELDEMQNFRETLQTNIKEKVII